MWIFLSDAFISVVQHPTKKDTMVVRARVEGDIERIFPGKHAVMTPGRDYRFRIFTDRDTIKRMFDRQIEVATYENFKNSVEDDDRHTAYFRCWAAMNELQQKMAITRPKARAAALFDEEGLGMLPPWALVSGNSPAEPEPCQNRKNNRRRKP
jgi:hypothetical protein